MELGDFGAAPSAAGVGAFNKVPTKGWYSASLNGTGLANLNKTGLTQFRLYFSLDDNNNLKADSMQFASGNALLSTDRPVISIIYTLP